MDMRGRNLLVFLFLLPCVQNLTNELVSATSETNETYFNVPMTKFIEEQVRGSRDVCADILGEDWKNHTKSEQNPCKTLTVWVPKKADFPEFVNVSEDGELVGGFSIHIFCLALQELPFKIQTIFVPFMGGYDNLVKQIKDQDCQAVAGDITIKLKRTLYADFTIPYIGSDIYMLVPATQEWSQNLLTLLKPFSTSLWVTIIVAYIYIGVAIEILEYRVGNPEFDVPFFQKLLMIVWFPISTVFFFEGRIQNRCSKFVLVIWLTMLFIVIQIFTACLSSWLVINQLNPMPQVVGYQSGSYVGDSRVVSNIGPKKEKQLLPLLSVEDYKKALDSGNVDAILDELPYIDVFLAKYGDAYMKIGPLAEEPGFAFGFSRGCSIQTNFSRAILKVTGSKDMAVWKEIYLGVQTPAARLQPTQPLPQSLNVRSFTLLFIFMGIATVMAIIYSEISLMHYPTQVFPINNRSAVQTTSENSIQLAPNQH